MRPLYNHIVTTARQPDWYEQGGAPDTLDGRFDLLAALMAITLLHMEGKKGLEQQQAWLTEIFVDDMDAQLREIGIGDMIVGKHIGRMMGVLGGRVSAFRSAYADPAKLDDIILRNIYDGVAKDPAESAYMKTALGEYRKSLTAPDLTPLLTGGS